MKRVLAFLMCVILMHAMTPFAQAKRGGPDVAVQSGVGLNVVGTYSGVLIPTAESATNTSSKLNSIGVFSVAAPTAGIATGTFTFFADGEVFAGTITGIIDPDGRSLNGVLDATSTLNSGDGVDFQGQALGSITAEIAPNDTSTIVKGGSAARLNGKAHLDLFFGGFNSDLSVSVAGTFDFIVDGFKQSDTTTTTPVTTGNGTGGMVTGNGTVPTGVP